jgi:thimet oligopeptidase
MDTTVKRSVITGMVACGIIVAIITSWWNMSAHKQDDIQAVIKLFPTTAEEIKSRTEKLMQQSKKMIDAIIAIQADQRTFDNTIRALDSAVGGYFAEEQSAIMIMAYVSPIATLREASQEAVVTLGKFYLTAFSQNIDLYNACTAYVEGNRNQEELTATQIYYLDEVMRGFRRSGLDLPQEERDKVLALEQALTKTTSDFDFTINGDQTKVKLTHDELAGVDEDFIASLPKNDDGTFNVGVDYPTYYGISEHCTNAKTREKMFVAFRNRAYPQNVPVLEEIIAQRDKLAHLLGYNSFAAYTLAEEMVGSVERVDRFLNDLVLKAQTKARKEFAELTKDLPEGVSLSSNGKLHVWDKLFVKEQYKKKHFKLDDRIVAEYFPTEKTIEGLFRIYEQFFSLSFQRISVTNVWDPEVEMLQVTHAPTNTLLGYLLLDLYPRPNKYSHACHASIIHAHTNKDKLPAVSVVLANFPKATASKPALLKLDDVRTFFHEFGHALHALFGRTEFKSLAGTSTKRDFVELPSQMLEEWLWDKFIVKNLSAHYQTGEHMPDEMLDAIIALKNFSTGEHTLQQLMYSRLALEYYAEGETKDTTAILHRLCNEMLITTECSDDDHMQAAFGHLTGYGPRYYGYLWSKVFALDVFEQIKKEGLLNAVVGARYVGAVLSKGGSKDPNDLLKDFLGREPNSDAFFRDLGLDQ